ncbi:MAG: hypothetical protein OEW08_10270, partial [Gammaproteobacteria bacterium]|nr:hypothetical protein [Gammaproteobacteria bacterium]
MLPNSRFYTGALLGTWMALGAMGQAYGALIADDFNEQPTTTPLPDTSQVVMDTTVPNAVGAGGYTNAALWTKFFRRGSLNTGITTTIT